MVTSTTDKLTAPSPTASPSPDSSSAAANPVVGATFTHQDEAFLKSIGSGLPGGEDRKKTINDLWDEVDRRAQDLKTRPWNTTARGRFAIRAISRGIVGAAFYSFVQVKASKDMEGYNPDLSLREIWRNERGGKRNFLQVLAKIGDSTISKSIEKTVNALGGDGKQAVTFRDTRVYYRDSATGKKLRMGRSFMHEAIGVSGDFYAMSVGDGLVRDYLTGIVDPNVEKTWLKKKEIKDAQGHVIKTERSVDIPEALKCSLKAIWRLTTFNGGEDIFVTIPYIFYMKWQRKVLDKFSPGFRYDSDHSLNGGSFKVQNKRDKDGKLTNEIRFHSDFQAEGMLDLMGRFSAYNYGTLMFREGYNKLGKTLTDWWKHDKKPHFELPHSLPEAIDDAFNGAYKAGRYLVKSFIKAYTYMIPASFVFAAMRSPQSKDIGLLIHQDRNADGKRVSRGALVYQGTDKNKERIFYLQANGVTGLGHIQHESYYQQVKPEDWNAYRMVNGELIVPKRKSVRPLFFSDDRYNLDRHHDELIAGGDSPEQLKLVNNNLFQYKQVSDTHWKKTPFDFEYSHEQGKEAPISSRIWQQTTNTLGNIAHIYGDALKPIAEWSGRLMSGKRRGEMHPSQMALPPQQRGRAFADRPWINNPNSTYTVGDANEELAKSYSRRFAKAAVSYWPYFFVKTDLLSHRWDTPRMDMALNRTLDGLFDFKWGEFKAGIGEYISALRNAPLSDPDRELQAREAILKRKGVLDSDGSVNKSWAEKVSGQGETYSYVNGGTTQEGARKFATERLKRSHSAVQPNIDPWVARAEAERRYKEQNAPTTATVQ